MKGEQESKTVTVINQSNGELIKVEPFDKVKVGNTDEYNIKPTIHSGVAGVRGEQATQMRESE